MLSLWRWQVLVGWLGAASRDLIPIPRCGHVPHEELPRIFMQYLSQFLSDKIPNAAKTIHEESCNDERKSDDEDDNTRRSEVQMAEHTEQKD